MGERESALHAGHRARMRERFLRTGGAAMQEHELLELLLFWAVPRRDTNELAHALIEEFGSLAGVLEADADLLCRLAGIGEGTAVYLRLLGETARRYTVEKTRTDEEITVYDTVDKVIRFLFPHFIGLQVERAYLLLFDNGMHLIDCHHVCDGSVTGVTVSIRRMIEQAYRKGAAAAILAHNHPGGLAVPSQDDIKVTRRLDEAFRLMEVPLLEHYVFGERGYAPIMSKCRVGNEQDYAASSLFDLLHDRLGSISAGKEE